MLYYILKVYTFPVFGMEVWIYLSESNSIIYFYIQNVFLNEKLKVVLVRTKLFWSKTCAQLEDCTANSGGERKIFCDAVSKTRSKYSDYSTGHFSISFFPFFGGWGC